MPSRLPSRDGWCLNIQRSHLQAIKLQVGPMVLEYVFLHGTPWSRLSQKRYRLHLNAFYKGTVVFYTTGTDFNICLYMWLYAMLQASLNFSTFHQVTSQHTCKYTHANTNTNTNNNIIINNNNNTNNNTTHLLRTIFANSDVECILRAKTPQLHLIGMGRWRDPRKIEKVPSPCPVLDEISWQIAKTVQIEKFESKLFGNGMVVLGLATSHVRKWSRYVTKASLRHITMERQCLRWWMTARPCIHPLLKWRFYIYSDVPHTQRHQSINQPCKQTNKPRQARNQLLKNQPTDHPPNWPHTHRANKNTNAHTNGNTNINTLRQRARTESVRSHRGKKTIKKRCFPRGNK